LPETKKQTEETVEVEKKKTIPKTISKRPTSRRKKQIDLDREILCKSVVSGSLKYISKKNGMEVVWANYGDEQYVDATELVAMKASQPKFITEPWLYIDDEELVEHLGLKQLYEKVNKSINVDELFNKSAKEVKQVVIGLPRSLQETIADKAREYIKEGKLNNLQVVRTLEKELNTELIDEE
jgi:hypothetical protein